jgi:hypothetical protein
MHSSWALSGILNTVALCLRAQTSKPKTREGPVRRCDASLGVASRAARQVRGRHRGVPEACVVDRVRVSTTDFARAQHRHQTLQTVRDRPEEGRPGGGYASAQRIQDVNRQLLARLGRETVEFGASGVPGESFHLGESSDGHVDSQIPDRLRRMIS